MSALEAKANEFISASGKGGLVTTKCLKKINEDCNLKSVTGMDQNGLDICFSGAIAKMKAAKTGMTPAQFCVFINDHLAAAVAQKKKADKDEIAKRLTDQIVSGSTQAHGTTKTSKTGGVKKMTDSSQYTGSHKERFGADGKGLGKDGRVDEFNTSGYVGNYKNEGTYESK